MNIAFSDMLKKQYFKYIKIIILTSLIIGNCMLSWNNSVWYDEVYSLNLVQGGQLSDIIMGTAQDVHPPLYYLILKLGLIIGNDLLGLDMVYVAKLISMIPLFIVLIVNHICVRKWIGDIIWLHSFCVLTMPRIVSHAGIEIRMYSWAALFVYIAFISAVYIIREKEVKQVAWWTITLASLAASYCHYFACIAAFFVYVGLFIWLLFSEEKQGKIKKFFLSGIGVFVGYLPWLIVLSGQLKAVGNDYWIERVGLSACIQIMEYPFGDNASTEDMICFVMLVTSVILALVSLLRFIKDTNVKLAVYALSVLALTVITGVVVSRLFRPIFVPRYMIPTLCCFWLGIILLTKDAGRVRKSIIVAILLIGGLYNFVQLYRHEERIDKQVDEAVTVLEIAGEEQNVYVTDNMHLYYVLSLYGNDKQKVCLIREEDGWQNISEFVNADYAVAMRDGFLEEYIKESWEDKGDYTLEVYKTAIYKKNAE